MGSREAPYDKHKECDNCGEKGAHDFMGDYFCDKCVSYDETFELTEEVFARWDEENEKWYNKYFVIPFHTFINIIKNFPSEVKWFYQRGSRGWSDRSAWSIDTWLVDNLIPMLERLKRDKHGTPSTMFRKKDGVSKNGIPTDEANILAEQRWDNVLNEIIYGLKCAKKIEDFDYDYEDKELIKRLTKSYQRSFELIGKHLFSLWD
jgi:hypothetical protein